MVRAKSEHAEVANAEAADDDSTGAWRSFDATTYEEAAQRLVHHSFKTINSNAGAGGVRLSAVSALDLPYVSARTLLSRGVILDLDYTANSGATATVVKQIRAVARGTQFAAKAPDSERRAILDAIQQVSDKEFATGIDVVDPRMRQVLLPRRDGTYVSYTPLTAGGVCSLLFDGDTGLVTRHDDRARSEGRQRSDETADAGAPTGLRPIPRAHLGIGGSNPQNVGSLVRSMQRPMYVPGPMGNQSIRVAFSIYYKGIAIALPRDFASAYREIRASLHDGSGAGTRMSNRVAEEQLMRRIAAYALAVGAEALETLQAFEDALPKEHPINGRPELGYEIVSQRVAPSIRGLIDPRLRLDDWPSRIAREVVRTMRRQRHVVDGQPVSSIPLDAAAEAKLESLLEEAFR